MASSRVTMGDIAKKMGLSKSTISTALSDKYGVSESLRSKILLTALEMNYDFGSIRKKAPRGVVSLIIGDDSYLCSPFWYNIIAAVEQSLTRNGKSLQLLISKQYDAFEEVLLRIGGRNTEGVLLLADGDEEQILKVAGLQRPLVLIDSRRYAGLNLNQIRMSNYESGYVAAKYFAERGHKNLAFVGNRGYSYSFRLRANGFCNGAEEFGCTCTVYDSGEPKPEEGFEVAELKRMLREQSFPLAVFTGNDFIAQDLCFRAEKAGIRVPEQLSVIGFDNISDRDFLTTFDVPREVLGDKAVELLMRVIENREAPPEIISIGSQLIERGSVCDLNHAKE